MKNKFNLGENYSTIKSKSEIHIHSRRNLFLAEEYKYRVKRKGRPEDECKWYYEYELFSSIEKLLENLRSDYEV